jgi:hypothetical protein
MLHSGMPHRARSPPRIVDTRQSSLLASDPGRSYARRAMVAAAAETDPVHVAAPADQPRDHGFSRAGRDDDGRCHARAGFCGRCRRSGGDRWPESGRRRRGAGRGPGRSEESPPARRHWLMASPRKRARIDPGHDVALGAPGTRRPLCALHRDRPTASSTRASCAVFESIVLPVDVAPGWGRRAGPDEAWLSSLPVP